MRKKTESFQDIGELMLSVLNETENEIKKYCESRDVITKDAMKNLKIFNSQFIYRPMEDGSALRYQLRKKLKKNERPMLLRAIFLNEETKVAQRIFATFAKEVGKSKAATLFAAAYEFGRRLCLFDLKAKDIKGWDLHIKQTNGSRITNAAHVELHPIYQSELEKLMITDGTIQLNYEKATNVLAKRLGVSITTVKRHTTNKWPSKGGRPKKSKT